MFLQVTCLPAAFIQYTTFHLVNTVNNRFFSITDAIKLLHKTTYFFGKTETASEDENLRVWLVEEMC